MSPLVLVLLLGLAAPGADRLALLQRADVGAGTPASFRAEVSIALRGAAGTRIEIWRAGDARMLVRFLDEKQRGKYLLYDDSGVWFLSPSAKPVKLPRAYRLRGSITLDDILGRRYSTDYSIASSEEREEGGQRLVVYDLRAVSPALPYPRVLYAVREDTARPVWAAFHLPSGRRASVLSFEEWAAGSRTPRPRRLSLRDELRGGEVTEVEVQALEVRDVPAGLLQRDDPAERRKLEAAPPR